MYSSWMFFIWILMMMFVTKNYIILLIILIEFLILAMTFVAATTLIDMALWTILILSVSAMMAALALSIFTYFTSKNSLSAKNLMLW